MAFTENENGMGTTMLVSPSGYAGNNGGFGGFGGDLFAWLLIAMLFGGGFGGGWGMGGFGGGYDFPWLLTGQQNINTNTNNGFRDAMINDGITSVRDGIASLSTQLCSCCGEMQMALANGFANAEHGANSRAMANLQQLFGVQTQLAQASADNRLGVANLGSDIAREACATRTNDSQNTQAILTAINGGIQSVKDQLCQDKIDAKNDEIAQLRQEVLFARGKDSQDLQTAQIVNDTYNRLATCPVGTTPVYGNQPIFTCNSGCGNNCGCGSF